MCTADQITGFQETEELEIVDHIPLLRILKEVQTIMVHLNQFLNPEINFQADPLLTVIHHPEDQISKEAHKKRNLLRAMLLLIVTHIHHPLPRIVLLVAVIQPQDHQQAEMLGMNTLHPRVETLIGTRDHLEKHKMDILQHL